MWCGYHHNHHRFYCTNNEMKSVFLVFKLTKNTKFTWICSDVALWKVSVRVDMNVWFWLVCSFIYFMLALKKVKFTYVNMLSVTTIFFVVITLEVLWPETCYIKQPNELHPFRVSIAIWMFIMTLVKKGVTLSRWNCK